MLNSARRLLALCVSLSLLGCVAHAPLGDDWEQLSTADRDARALEALRELFRGQGAGAVLDGREVEQVDLAGISYTTAEGESRLRWEDVESVRSETHEEVTSRPETVMLYVRPNSTSDESVFDLQRPLLSAVGIARRYLLLQRRPRWSRLRLLAALDHLRDRRDERRASSLGEVAPVTSQQPVVATPGPSPSSAPTLEADPNELESLDDVEAKLRKLKEWHEAELITPEEYAEKRAQLLSGM